MLTRRHAMLAGAAALLSATRARADDWLDSFKAVRATNSWLIGYDSAPDRLDCPSLTIEGKWPAGLAGTFYRNGPARHQVGGLRYHHWFDGDGMVQAFRIADGRIAHQGRMVMTDKYRRELAAGRPLERGFGTALAELPPPRSPGALNVANINVISHAGRLLALWEGADAYALDPATLETKGLQVWRDDLKGVPFSAHPRLEPDGTLWSFGYSPLADLLLLYRIGADGTLQTAKALRVEDVGMVHDFVTTERHLVFPVGALFLRQGAGEGGRRVRRRLCLAPRARHPHPGGRQEHARGGAAPRIAGLLRVPLRQRLRGSRRHHSLRRHPPRRSRGDDRDLALRDAR